MIDTMIDSQSSNKYSYSFGIDEISFSQVVVNDNMCFISEDINIGNLDSDEYLQISSTYDEGDNGSIEFYILDGTEAKAVIPIESEKILNEKIFFGLRTRFGIDEDYDVTIKKDGVEIDIDLDKAIDSNEDGYTVDYTPMDGHNIRVSNHSVRVKVILRTYDKKVKAPSIKNIVIRKYGRSLLWKNDTTK